MPSLMFLLALAASPDLVMGPFNFVDVKPELQEFVLSHLAQRFQAEGFSIITQRDVAMTLGVERQRQLLGCAQDSCAVEIVAALGADSMVVGDVARLAGRIQVNLRLVSSRSARTQLIASAHADSERELLDALESAVHDLASKLRRATTSAATSVTAPPSSAAPVEVATRAPGRSTWGVVLGSVGLAALVAGGVLWGLAFADRDRLRAASATMSLTVDQSLFFANQGANLQRAAFGLLVGGGVAAVTGVTLWLTGGARVAVSVVPGPAGTSFSVQGAF